MMILTKAIKKHLAENHAEQGRVDHFPVLKLFTPWGANTWLITEMDEHGIMWGLCDLGMGEPELGCVSLAELMSVRGPWGLKLERDRHFKASQPISEYAADARDAGRITA